jgi:hypothetical protein
MPLGGQHLMRCLVRVGRIVARSPAVTFDDEFAIPGDQERMDLPARTFDETDRAFHESGIDPSFFKTSDLPESVRELRAAEKVVKPSG